MSYIDVEIYHNGNNKTSQLINYNREQFICTGVGVLTANLIDDSTNYDPWDEVILYEEGNKKGTYFIREVQRGLGEIQIDCQDSSLKLQEWFIDELLSQPYVTTARYWIQRFLNDAGVDYIFLTSDTGAPINNDAPFGATSAYEAIVGLLQMSNWYMHFNQNGVCIIGSLTLNTANPDETVNDDEILDLRFNTNDKMLRNRAVVWGGADIVYGNWIFADISINTPWNYGANDKRAVVLANQEIQTYYDADRLARQMLTEFSRITEEKVVAVVGELNVSIGDYIYINSDHYQGGGMLTTLSSEMSKSGFVTTLTLDQRCPRLFGFISNWSDYVYVGTAGDGIWRKPFDSSEWTNYSAGITDLGINDLSINNNIFSTTTFSGLAYWRTLLSSIWSQYIPPTISGVINASGVFVTDLEEVPSGIYAAATTVDKVNSNIYFAFTSNSGIISSGWGHLYSGGIPFGEGYSWLATLSNYGYLQRFDQVYAVEVDETIVAKITVIDLDNSGSDVIVSGYSEGGFILPPVASGDDGNFGDWWTGSWCAQHRDVVNYEDTRMETANPKRTGATDFSQISSLPPEDVISGLTLYSEFNSVADCKYNKDGDLGTLYATNDYRTASSTKYVEKDYWIYDGTYHIETDPSFEFAMTGFASTDRILSFWIDDESKDMHFLCTNYYSHFIGVRENTSASYYLKIYKYDYGDETLSLLSTKTFDYSTSSRPTNRRLAFSYRGGYGFYIYHYLYDDGTFFIKQLRAYIFNLKAGSYEDILITEEINSETFQEDDMNTVSYIPIPTKDYIIYCYINQYPETLGNAIWGDVHLYTLSLSTNDGSYTTNYKEIYDEGRGDDISFGAGEWPFVDESFEDIVKMREPFVMQNGQNSIFLTWHSFGNDDVYPHIHNIAYNLNEPLPPYTYIANEITLIACNITPTQISETVWQWWVDDVAGFGSSPFPVWAFYGVDYGGNVYGIGGKVFPSSSVIQSKYYTIFQNWLPTYECEYLDIHNYAVGEVTTGGITLRGYLDFPTTQISSTAKYLRAVTGKLDDIDQTIYAFWFTSSSPTRDYLIGHDYTGAITKDLSGLQNIVSSDTGEDWYDLSANTVIDLDSCWRWGIYEQPRGIGGNRYLVLKQNPEPNSFTIIHEDEYPARLDISRNAPTVAYFLSQSGQPLSNMATSWSNDPDTFQQWYLNFPLYDVRVFDIVTPTGFIVESGYVTTSGYRQIAFVSSGGVYFVDSLDPESQAQVLISASGIVGSGFVQPSGFYRMETTNYSPTYPYFFVSSVTSGFWQRNPDTQLWTDYTVGLPGSQITIIRTDDRI